MQIFVLSRTLNQGTEKKSNSLKMTNISLDANSLCHQSQTYSVLPDKLHLLSTDTIGITVMISKLVSKVYFMLSSAEGPEAAVTILDVAMGQHTI